MRRASCMSFDMIVLRPAWIAHRFVSSNSCTRYASAASRSASTLLCVKRKFQLQLKSRVISRIRRSIGALGRSSSPPFWYLRISRKACVPGR